MDNYIKKKLAGFEYKTINNKTFLSHKVREPISQGKILQLKNLIDNESFHLNILLNGDSVNVIEIHLKNVLNNVI